MSRLCAFALVVVAACSDSANQPDSAPTRVQDASTSASEHVPVEQTRGVLASRYAADLDAKLPPMAIVARPPSEQYPEGTILVSASFPLRLDKLASVLVLEWDLANARVVHEWVEPTSWRIADSAQIAFDGTRTVVLSSWRSNPRDIEDGYQDYCQLDVLDDQLERVRTRRVPCGTAVAASPHGRVLVGDFYEPYKGSYDAVTLRSYDATLNPGPHTMRFVPLLPGDSGRPSLHWAKGGFFLVVQEGEDARVVRLDERTLRQTHWSEPIPIEAGFEHVSFERTSNGWTISTLSKHWTLDPDLRHLTGVAHEDQDRTVVWQGSEPLGIDRLTEGERKGRACRPISAFGHAAFVCTGPDGLTVLRP